MLHLLDECNCKEEIFLKNVLQSHAKNVICQHTQNKENSSKEVQCSIRNTNQTNIFFWQIFASVRNNEALREKEVKR